MANGLLAIQGYQTGLPQGAQAIGPYSIPCSPIGALILVPASSSNVATAVPSENAVLTVGVVITAVFATAATYSAGFISSQLTRISPNYPCIWTWDAASIPTNVYVTVSNTAGAYVTLQFF